MLGVVSSGRAAAESLMLDACVITRVTEKGEWSDELGDYEPDTTTPVYSGKCRVVAENVAVREVQAGEQEVGVTSWRVSVPVTAETGAITAGDTLRVTAASSDPALVGRVFTVTGPFMGSSATARRIPVRAVV